MNSAESLVGQGAPEETTVCLGSDFVYLPISEDDAADFAAAPSARYIIREGDARDRADRPGARPLITVFRSGHRRQSGSTPGFYELEREVFWAEWHLERSPQLAADATPNAISCALLAPGFDRVSLLISGYRYIDAPGGISFGHTGVIVYRDFDPRHLPKGWAIFFGLYQRIIDKKRGFRRDRLQAYDSYFHFPRVIIAKKNLGEADIVRAARVYLRRR